MFTKKFDDTKWKQGEIGVLIYGDFEPEFYKFEEKTYKDYSDLWFSLEKIYCYIEKNKKGNYLCIYTKKSKILVLKIKIEKPLDIISKAGANIFRPLFITKEDLERQKLEKQLFNQFLDFHQNSKVTIKSEYQPFVIMVLKAVESIGYAIEQATESLVNLGYSKKENINKVKNINKDININLNSTIYNGTIDINSISKKIIENSFGRNTFL
jgi:hypothetical protein